jgi:hypothetical protein
MKAKTRGAEQQTDGGGKPRSIARVAIVVSLTVVCALAALYVLARDEPRDAASTTGLDTLAGTPYASSSTVQYVPQLVDIPPGKPEHVELIYFHRTQRCQSCMAAERLTRHTIESCFADQIASGDLSFSLIDVETGEGTEVVSEYDAYGPSLYIGVFKGGVHYVFHASDTYVALNNESAFMSILKGDVDYALGLG